MKLALLLCLLCACAAAQTAPAADPQLLAEINRMRAIDNHTHVEKLTAPGEKDDEFDALTCPEEEPADLPVLLRPDNPEVIDAWRALYGYKYADRSPEHLAELAKAKAEVRRREGDRFPEWVLDQYGVETMFANRIAMGRGLKPPRFRWVPYDDALMYPFDNSLAKAQNSDLKHFYEREENLLARYRKDSGIGKLPATLDDYVKQVILPTLQRQKQGGAIAIKFEMAYLRSLEVHGVDSATAARAFQQLVAGKPGPDLLPAYHQVQDFLFHSIAAEAGGLGLAVHIHTGNGCGRYFQVSHSNPLLLEEMLNDPSLKQTKFVLIHGGWPWTRQMASLLAKPNVYTDTSAMPFFLPIRSLAQTLREWLEFMPEKVLFGTDLFAADESVGWEDEGWIFTRHGREALALALTGMLRDGEITRERALEIARMVLHDNATKLYGDLGR
jgi:predicted TIM-barrel fold metal-dependent hydrolase